MLMPMLWTNNDNDMMNVMRDPFEDMDRLMNSFWGDFSGANLGQTQMMRTDVIDEEHDYKLQADLPGFDKQDIQVDMKDGVLSISASHQENKEEKDGNGKFLRRERRSASYQRSFNVGDAVKPEEIDASYENGVLTLTIPKKDPQIEQKDEVKRIEVK